MQCVRESNCVENSGNVCTGVKTEYFRILIPHRGDSGARSISGQELQFSISLFPSQNHEDLAYSIGTASSVQGFQSICY